MQHFLSSEIFKINKQINKTGSRQSSLIAQARRGLLRPSVQGGIYSMYTYA